MFRKRRRPTPGYGIPPPYSPIKGEHADLYDPGIYPYCAMMQIAAEDTECEYVICRGYDPRNQKYYDYDGADELGISVAKPYWNRRPGVYHIGEVYPAILPLSAGAEEDDGTLVPFIGQNPGRVEGDSCKGHPADLTDEIVHVLDDNDVYINWMLLDGGSSSSTTELMLAEDHPGKGVVFKCYQGIWCPEDHTWRYDCTDGCAEWVWAIDHRYDVPYPDIGARGLFTPRASNTYGTIWECVNLDCSTPGTCADQDIDQPCPNTDSTNYAGACEE